MRPWSWPPSPSWGPLPSPTIWGRGGLSMMIVAEVMILLGALVLLISSYGTFKFQDVYNRLHAASISTSGGALLLGGGLSILGSLVHGKLFLKPLLIILIIFLTSPVSSHVVAQAAYRTGVPLVAHTVQDDLALAFLEWEQGVVEVEGEEGEGDDEADEPLAEALVP
ncbi:MAG: hypothetical protein CW349_03720 [Firmicutes bacterium]|nr:hypothetical protein [Bacillota bacterium]MBO2518796.1 hypothetical protein [Bacillota bacterium]